MLRAEPIASLFTQHRCHLVGEMPELEDQLSTFTSEWNRARDGSPDRIDAAVFALTELMEPSGHDIRAEALLAADAAAVVRPVELPKEVANVLAVAAITEAEPDALGVVYLAVPGSDSPLLVLDWHVELLEQGRLDASAARGSGAGAMVMAFAPPVVCLFVILVVVAGGETSRGEPLRWCLELRGDADEPE